MMRRVSVASCVTGTCIFTGYQHFSQHSPLTLGTRAINTVSRHKIDAIVTPVLKKGICSDNAHTYERNGGSLTSVHVHPIKSCSALSIRNNGDVATLSEAGGVGIGSIQDRQVTNYMISNTLNDSRTMSVYVGRRRWKVSDPETFT